MRGVEPQGEAVGTGTVLPGRIGLGTGEEGDVAGIFGIQVDLSGRPIVIGSKSDTEGALLGNLISLVLEDLGLRVERRLGLGPTLIVRSAFEPITIGRPGSARARIGSIAAAAAARRPRRLMVEGASRRAGAVARLRQ
jgi:hypothetical protein